MHTHNNREIYLDQGNKLLTQTFCVYNAQRTYFSYVEWIEVRRQRRRGRQRTFWIRGICYIMRVISQARNWIALSFIRSLASYTLSISLCLSIGPFFFLFRFFYLAHNALVSHLFIVQWLGSAQTHTLCMRVQVYTSIRFCCCRYCCCYCWYCSVYISFWL